MAFGGFNFASSSTQPAQPQAQGQGQGQGVPQVSLTGPTPTATPTATPFSFGSATAAPAPAASSGLFGSTNTNTNANSQPQQQQQGGGLFGGNNGASSGGGIFGSKPAGGLFGGQSTSTPQPAGGSTSLFGQPQQQQNQNQGQGQGLGQSGSLFGQPQQQQGQTSLFGSQQQPQQQQQQQQQQQNTFGSKPLGQLTQSSGPSTSTTQGQGGMQKGTKFTDLPEGHQKMIEQLDSAFKQQKQLVYGTLDSRDDLQRAIVQVSSDVKSAEAECTSLSLGLQPLQRAYESLSTKVKMEEEDLQRLADIWSSYRPSDGRPSNLRAGALREFRKGYFRKVVADSEERIPRYKKTITELRRAVESLSRTNDIPSPQAIAQTISNHQDAIYTLAAQVEGLEVRWNDVREYYSSMYKEKTGSIRDPLDVARERQGIPPVRT